MIFGGFWSTTHRTQTLTRTFLNPHAPHRAPTPTHPTPTTPHTARAPALRSRAVLRQRFVCISAVRWSMYGLPSSDRHSKNTICGFQKSKIVNNFSTRPRWTRATLEPIYMLGSVVPMVPLPEPGGGALVSYVRFLLFGRGRDKDIHGAKSPRESRREPFFLDPRDTIFVFTTSILL